MVLLEVMFHRRVCPIGGPTGAHVLQEDVSYRRIGKVSCIGWHVLHKGRYYRKTCITGEHIYLTFTCICNLDNC